MTYIIQNDVDIIYELINSFHYLSNEDELKNNFESILIESNINPETYINKNLKNFFKFIDKFKSKITISNEKLNMYFGNIFAGYTSRKNIAYCLFSNITVEELQDFREMFKALSYEASLKLICKELISNIENDESSDIIKKIKNYDDLTDYLINNASLKENSKWWISMICKHPQKYIIELIDILLNSINTFRDCFKILEKDKLKFIESIKNYTGDYSDFVGINLDYTEDILLYPSLINFNSISVVTSLGTIAPERTCLYFGWKFKELTQLKHKNSDETVLFQDQLKCISDKSKFEILKILKEKPLYGQEIAESLKLTTATVSYHMNALFLSNLISVNKVNNRIYYSINEENIDSFLDTLTKQLKTK